MDTTLLIEYRCACGKLLFKGFMLISVVEIKCKRCGKMRIFRNSARGARSFMLVVDVGGRIVDACEGVAVLELSRKSVIGKLLFDILPLVRDAHYQEIIPAEVATQDPAFSNGTYQIKNNSLLLRDCKLPIESHVIPVNNSLYRVFNILKNL